jgi:hypothetical protein
MIAIHPDDVSEVIPVSRFSTSTVRGLRQLVPWLAADGPLSYNPMEPPNTDYFFKYNWILPGIFNPSVNRREIFYFGSYDKSDVRLLFDFWNRARQGRGMEAQIYSQFGVVADGAVTAPIAAYRCSRPWRDTPGALLIQHGSYQWVALEDQPLIERGQVLLYRGIGDATEFRSLRFGPEDLAPGERDIWARYLGAQAAMLSDSVLSFNTVHDRVARSETTCFRHASRMSDEIALRAGLDIDSPGFANDLWNEAQQAYTLDPVIAEHKFGPNYVMLKTSLNNIRLTTFVANESEVKIVDPARISSIVGHGCDVKFASPTD